MKTISRLDVRSAIPTSPHSSFSNFVPTTHQTRSAKLPLPPPPFLLVMQTSSSFRSEYCRHQTTSKEGKESSPSWPS